MTTAELLAQVDPDWNTAFDITKGLSPYKSAFRIEPVSESAYNAADLKSAITGEPMTAKPVGTSSPTNTIEGAASRAFLNLSPDPREMIKDEVKKEYGSPINYINDFNSEERSKQRAKQIALESLYKRA